MKRFDLINWFIQTHGYERYLEIGIDNPSACFDKIQAPHKIGVDPNKSTTYRMTSDAFFEEKCKEQIDIAFIDGLHVGEQALRDVENCLKWLSDEGTIIMHDCRPYNSRCAAPQKTPGHSWSGTVWLAWATLRATRADLSMHMLPFDCGLGIVRRGSQELYTGPYGTYEEWTANQLAICSLIDKDGLRSIYGR